MKISLALKKFLSLFSTSVLVSSVLISSSFASEAASEKDLSALYTQQRNEYLSQLKKQGHSASTLRQKYHYTASQLKNAGFTARELLAADFPYRELRRAGFTIADLMAAGVKRYAIFASKAFSWDEMAKAGIVTKNIAYGRFLKESQEDCGCWCW